MLTPIAALLLGLTTSGHCLVMCGGVTTALGVATAKGANGHPQPFLLLGYQLGRVSSYALMGLLLAGGLGFFINTMDMDTVRSALRALSAVALLLAALVAFGWTREPGFGLGKRLWRNISPIARRLLPVSSLPRAVAFGMIWGWMPCGFVYAVLLIAAMQGDALRGATTMAAFGLGTLPSMLLAAFGAHRFAGVAASPATRRVAGCALIGSAVLTLAGPWLTHSSWLHAALPFTCQMR